MQDLDEFTVTDEALAQMAGDRKSAPEGNLPMPRSGICTRSRAK